METIFTRHFIDGNYDRWPPSSEYHRYAALTNYSDFFNEVFDTTSYSVIQMESGLKEASSIPKWIQNMKIKYNGEEAKLEEIFETYTFSD